MDGWMAVINGNVKNGTQNANVLFFMFALEQ